MAKLNKIIIEVTIPELIKVSFKMWLLECGYYPDDVTALGNYIYRCPLDSEKKERRVMELVEKTVNGRLRAVSPLDVNQLKLFEA